MNKVPKTAWICLGIAASILAAAWLAPPLARLLEAPGVPSWLQRRDGMSPERVFGRLCLLFLSVVMIAGAIASGVRRPRDLGWHGGRRLAAEILAGLAAGLAMLGVIGTLSVACDARRYVPPGWGALPARIPNFARIGFGAAVFEETVFRGLLFLAFVRAGRTRAGVLVTSLLYATAHWLEPADAPGEASTPLSILRGVGAALAGLPAGLAFWLVLFLAGIALCISVQRTGRLGWAVGLHAGWIIGLKAIIFLTDTVPDTRCPGILFGGDGAVEGIVGVAFMAALLAALYRLPRRSGNTSCSAISSA